MLKESMGQPGLGTAAASAAGAAASAATPVGGMAGLPVGDRVADAGDLAVVGGSLCDGVGCRFAGGEARCGSGGGLESEAAAAVTCV